MGLKDDLVADVRATFIAQWEVQTTTSVPAAESLRLNSNHAKDLQNATVLYADLDGSTQMVDDFDWRFSAEVYKTYLRCAAQVIRSEEGVITAYDGDRIMAVYTGEFRNTRAVRSAMKINYAVVKILRPALQAHYPSNAFYLKHVIGVDTSPLRATRTGVRGENDLVWVGRAANHAAKLTDISEKPLWITKAVFDRIDPKVKFSNGVEMWTPTLWTAMNNAEIYSSTWIWPIN